MQRNARTSFSSLTSLTSLVFLGGLVLLPHSVVAAEPSAKERAATLLQEGVQRRAEGNDERALLLFRQADALDSTPKSRAQLALAEQSLGMWVAAEKHLRDALAQVGDPWIEKNRALLESSLGRITAELGFVDLMGVPQGAEIFVDGERVGRSPLDAPARAAAGTRLVEVKAAGYEPYTRRIVVRGGEVSRERGVFVKQRVEEPGARSAAGPTGPRYVEVSSASPWRTVGWVGLGAGVAAGLFGAAGLAIRQNYVDNYNTDGSCPGTSSTAQPLACASRQSSVSRWTAIGVASLVSGGVLAAAGLTFVLASPNTRTKVAVSKIEGSCGLAGAGFSCGGTFQ